MGKIKSVKVETHQEQAIEDMVETGRAGNASEALREALNAGLRELGYRGGVCQDTRLRRLTRRFADGFALLGIMWVGLTFMLPIELRMYAAGPFAASLTCLTIDRVLESVEPSVTNRLTAMVGGVL